MKKMSVVLAVCCVLMFSSLDVLEAMAVSQPETCCFSFWNSPLPVDKVVKFSRTGSHCVRDAIVFRMQKGGKICTDRSKQWVQDVITKVQNRRKP